MNDLIYRQAAINAVNSLTYPSSLVDVKRKLVDLPSVQPTLYGYNLEHLAMIARVLQKEGLPPERVTEALIGIGRIVAIIQDEFEETLRRAVKNVEGRTDE